MKNTLIFPLMLLLIMPDQGFCQIRIPVKKKTERRVNKEIDDTIDKGLEEIFGGKKKKTKQTTTGEPAVEEEASETAEVLSNEEPLSAWTKFDFVPGDVVIFEDNLEGETNGEFPSQWDLYEGNVEIAKYGEEMVINFPATENGDIVPLMKKPGDYLPEKFTVEFDAY